MSDAFTAVMGERRGSSRARFDPVPPFLNHWWQRAPEWGTPTWQGELLALVDEWYAEGARGIWMKRIGYGWALGAGASHSDPRLTQCLSTLVKHKAEYLYGLAPHTRFGEYADGHSLLLLDDDVQ